MNHLMMRERNLPINTPPFIPLSLPFPAQHSQSLLSPFPPKKKHFWVLLTSEEVSYFPSTTSHHLYSSKMSKSLPCSCKEDHPPIYLEKATLNDSLYLDHTNRTRANFVIMGKRAAEAEQGHTLAVIRRKIEWLQRFSEAQHKGSALGGYLGSIN